MSSTPEYLQEYVDRGSDQVGLQIYPEPEDVTDAPVVVICPAMGVPARYYRPFAAALRAAGLAVVVADLRGTGASTPAPSRLSGYGYAELVADVGAVLDAVKPQRDGRRTLLLGHSLGGQAAALHLALTGDRTVDGLVLVASGVPYWRAFPGPRGYGVLPYTQGIAATAALLRVWPGWGFGGRQARGVIRDWAYAARTGRFPAIDGVDAEAALATVLTPVFAVSVDDDQYTPPRTLDHLCAKLAAAPVRREHYTTAQAGAPTDHFTWVRASVPLAARIADFAAGLAR
ncbi:alpha/beta fold hydrolase [Micromonospora sp. NPDC049679]|uniref:alpha/beta hydrolase family protein n=1 Tax=Micromonospora sp. NPDC049679 TaxID=3155920 RepID=UPI0033E8C6E6